MFDFLALEERDERLAAVRSFFCDHAHELVEAVGHIGGALAEARVVDLGLRLENADRVGCRTQTDLKALYRLLTLQTVADPMFEEDQYFAAFDPAS